MIFLKKPIPYKDESLSSYLFRLSLVNSCPYEWVLKEFHISSLMTRNIDLLKKEEIINKIAQSLDFDVQDVHNMTLNKYPLYKWDSTKRFYHGSKRKIDKYFELVPKFCPICIEEEKYIRLHWYFKLLKSCAYHKTALVKECDICGKSVTVRNVITTLCDCGRKLDIITCQQWDNNYYSHYALWEIWLYKEIGVLD
jgi:hypothetical protein